jgi:Fe-S-cluster-containing dehydrogenase component/formate-dependent nitrite reductase membrane component NrfD
MTKYGFVIDQRACIGCHACTIACKSENQVPVGAFRTWVKYIEKGVFPNTRRYFTVERCQHCEDAPCVEICPTRSLYKRHDGIVDFDANRCIGCKSCMQACPYDALYIDPNTHTAAKCNYCAHRTDRGLLPACVIVCPVKAIIAGDLEDPSSEIAQTLAREQVQVRRPDQGTRPQVFYVGADETAITPGLAAQPSRYMWSELGPSNVTLEPKGSLANHPRVAPGDPLDGLAAAVRAEVEASPRRAERISLEPVSRSSSSTHAVTVYDVAHPKPWGWRVSSYLWTKSIGGGALAVAGPLLALGLLTHAVSVGAGLLGALFTALTAVLLVWDLKRPDRFWRVLLTPNLRSWLPWGAYILTVYGALATAWFVAAAAGVDAAPKALAWPALAGGVAACGYSAFLFGQAEGRDFWQSPLLLWQLLGAAALAGGAVLVLIAVAFDRSNHTLLTTLSSILLGGVLATLAVVLVEVGTPHSNKDVAVAAATMKRGFLARRFWLGYVAAGGVLPAALLIGALAGAPLAGLSAVAAVSALIGLWFYEDVWIRAGQSVAMS